ncbi:MAG: LAS superfamily LD-carboxypeptidase LdcB [Glaciecola sp.]|jgi:LAS superfamily LD-carboxypeptidase LdcB
MRKNSLLRNLLRKILFIGLFFAALPLSLFALLYVITPSVEHLSTDNVQTSAFMQLYCSNSPCTINWTEYDEISNLLKEAVIKIEDPGFFTHDGFRLAGILHAIKLNIKARAYVKAASSISQQTAKNLFYYADKTIWRKLKEAIITVKLEQTLSKQRILEIYLNIIEFGPNTYGINNGAKYHFDKSPSELTFEEVSALIAIIPSPRAMAPLNSFKAPSARQQEISQLILESKHPVATQKALSDTQNCEQILAPKDRAYIDSALDKTYLNSAHHIEAGNGVFLSYQSLTNNLNTSELDLLNKILIPDNVSLKRLMAKEALIKRESFVAQNSRSQFGSKNYWLPKHVSVDLEKLILKANQNDIELKIESAYRGAGYQAYLALLILKRVNYCLPTAFSIVEKPFLSEHGDYLSTAIDFRTNHHRGITFERSSAYNWLLENAAEYNFYLSYPPNNDKGKAFEPWHWRHALAYENKKN